MSSLSVTNTFVDGTVITASGHNQNFADIVNYINNRNSASATWDFVSILTSTGVPLTVDNSSGTSNIVDFKDNGVTVFSIIDSGEVVITIPGGAGTNPLVIDNNSSSGLCMKIDSADSSGPFIMFTENGTDKWRLGHDLGQSPSESFVLRELLSGFNPLLISNDGIVTTINQSSCRVYRTTSTQTVTAGNTNKVQFNAESYDTRSEFDSATNYRFTATRAGKYLVSTQLQVTQTGASTGVLYIYVNGSSFSQIVTQSTDSQSQYKITDVLNLAASDYVEIYLNASGTDMGILAGQGISFLSIHKIS